MDSQALYDLLIISGLIALGASIVYHNVPFVIGVLVVFLALAIKRERDEKAEKAGGK